jgi:hypothetical protein
MSDDAHTREIVEALSLQPESRRFFDELWERAPQRERAEARRWRRAAMAMSVVALAAVTVAGVLVAAPSAAQNVVDRTVQCTNLMKGGLPVFNVYATPSGDPSVDENGKLHQLPSGFRPANGLTVQTGDVLDTLALSSLVSGYSLDRRQCVPAKARLKLAPQGLPHALKVRLNDFRPFNRRCTDVAKIALRIRITNDAFGAPLRAQLLVVRAKSQKPLIYVDWSRQEVDSWAADSCSTVQ